MLLSLSSLLRRARHAVCSVLALSLLLTVSALAQSAGSASVQGAVTDATGANVSGATVTLVNTETGTSRSTVTDAAGLYSLPNVPVGPAKLTISAPGFRGYTQSKIVLEVGNNVTLNAALTVGAITETVEVQSSGTAVEIESSDFKQVIDQQRITELPLNGRQATELILVSGGAVNAPGNDLVGSKSYASSVAIAVAGAQGDYNNYVLDGGTNTDTFTNVNLPYPFPDALREFSVESNSLPARNGVHPGSLVNVITNSGANQFHGTAFDFIRNNYINATNFFATSKDSLHRNQFGGTLGGPVLIPGLFNGRDKLFFFGGFQGTRSSQASNASNECVPTAAELTGDFSQQPTAGSCSQAVIGAGNKLIDPVTGADITATRKLPSSSLSPQALALVKLLPLAQANPTSGLIQIALPNISSEDQYVARLDYTLSQKNSVFFSFFLTNYKQPAFYQPNNLLLTTTAGNDERVMHYTLGETFVISPKLVNTFHGTYARRRDNRGPTAGGINATAVGVNFNPYVAADFRLSVSNGFNIGCGTCSPGFFNTNTEDFSDDVDYLRGKHQIAGGVEFIRTGDNTNAGYLQNGSFSFSGALSGAKNKNVGEPLIDFLTGQQNAFSQSRAQQTTYRQNIFSAYVQDTYHLSQRVTINAGVRYEPYFVPVDKFGRGSEFSQAAFDANQHSATYPLAPAGSTFYGDAGVSKAFAKNSPRNFSPRLGFTVDPFGNGKTVFRFGGAIMYDQPSLFAIQRITSNPPVVNEIDQTGQISFANPYSTYAGGNPFPGVFPPNATAPFPAGSLYVIIPQNLHTPTVDQWTASVQQDLGMGWNFSINYLGNKNSHLWVGTSFNPSVYIPGVSTGAVGSCGALTVVPAAGTACSSTKNTAQRTRLVLANPTQGAYYNYQMTLLDDGANSNYNGLITAVQHRMSHNFSFLANYTWSHCISPADSPGDVAGGVYEDPNNKRADRANCGYDVRHIFNVTGVAQSHVGGLNRYLAYAVNNWEIAPLLRILSGTPLNVTTGTDNSLNGVGLDRPNLVNAMLVYSGQKITQLAAGNRQYLSAKTAGAFAANATGTYGNLGRNAFRQPNYYDMDASVSRAFPIYERVALNLRFEGFNILNHPNFNGFTTALNSSQFGYATSTQAARIFQVAAKVTF
jgi:hypothetical protein